MTAIIELCSSIFLIEFADSMMESSLVVKRWNLWTCPEIIYEPSLTNGSLDSPDFNSCEFHNYFVNGRLPIQSLADSVWAELQSNVLKKSTLESYLYEICLSSPHDRFTSSPLLVGIVVVMVPSYCCLCDLNEARRWSIISQYKLVSILIGAFSCTVCPWLRWRSNSYICHKGRQHNTGNQESICRLLLIST